MAVVSHHHVNHIAHGARRSAALLAVGATLLLAALVCVPAVRAANPGDDTTSTTVAGAGAVPVDSVPVDSVPTEPGAPSEPAPVLGEPDPSTRPTAPGASDTPAPTGSAPGEQPVTYTLSPEETYGACADQGPVISGDLLSRLNLAVEPDAEVRVISVTATGARVKEIEIPYYDWTTRAQGQGVTATGPATPRTGFWLWVAFDQLDEGATQLQVQIDAELADGRMISHGGERSDLPAFTIPVTDDLRRTTTETAEQPNGPVASGRETPLNGRTPCRIGEPPTSGATGGALLPMLATGFGGVLAGAVLALVLRRRSRR